MNYNEYNILLIIKVLLVLYMLFVPFFNTSFIYYIMNNTLSKILFILLIISITYYDAGLGLLVTLAYILSVNYKVYPKKYNYLKYKKQYNNSNNSDYNINLDNSNYYKYEISY